jgi:hypothetical protein
MTRLGTVRMVSVMPLTALGWVLAVMLGTRRRRLAGCLLAWSEPGGALAWLLAHHPLGRMAAVTIGRCVLAASRPALRATWAHEAEHIRQFERFGLLFPLVYSLESLRCLLRGKSIYRDNRFEVAARRAENKTARQNLAGRRKPSSSV